MDSVVSVETVRIEHLACDDQIVNVNKPNLNIYSLNTKRTARPYTTKSDRRISQNSMLSNKVHANLLFTVSYPAGKVRYFQSSMHRSKYIIFSYFIKVTKITTVLS